MAHLRATDRHFGVFDEHNLLDHEVQQLESERSPAFQIEIDALKKQKLALKEQLTCCARRLLTPLSQSGKAPMGAFFISAQARRAVQPCACTAFTINLPPGWRWLPHLLLTKEDYVHSVPGTIEQLRATDKNFSRLCEKHRRWMLRWRRWCSASHPVCRFKLRT